MEKEEIKSEIYKLIDKVPEDLLEKIYHSLKDFTEKGPDAIQLSHNLNMIFSEDKGLLERLAK